MHDELPTTQATRDPIANRQGEPTGDSATADPPSEGHSDRGDRPDDAVTSDPVPAPCRDGVGPPDERAPIPPGGDATTGSDGDATNGLDEAADQSAPPTDREGDDGEDEPLAYRLERLRLWRALATLAVVVARLIRSL